MSGEYYYTLLIVRSCACDCVCYLTIYHKSSQSELCVILLEQNNVHLLVNALNTIWLMTDKYDIIFCAYVIAKPNHCHAIIRNTSGIIKIVARSVELHKSYALERSEYLTRNVYINRYIPYFHCQCIIIIFNAKANVKEYFRIRFISSLYTSNINLQLHKFSTFLSLLLY